MLVLLESENHVPLPEAVKYERGTGICEGITLHAAT